MDRKEQMETLHTAFANGGIYADSERYLLRNVQARDKEDCINIYRAKDIWKSLLLQPESNVWEDLWNGLLNEDVLNTIIVRKADQRFCGFCGLQDFTKSDTPELSIEIVSDCQHQGIGTEVLPMLMKRYTEITGVKEYISKVFRDNIPSQKLMEKIGGKLDGTVPIPITDTEELPAILDKLGDRYSSFTQMAQCHVLLYRFQLR